MFLHVTVAVGVAGNVLQMERIAGRRVAVDKSELVGDPVDARISDLAIQIHMEGNPPLCEYRTGKAHSAHCL